MNLEGKDLVSIRDLTKEEIFFILGKADEMLPFASGEKRTRALDGKILATLFFEPSTRTKMSFETAMHRLGGDVIGFSEPAMTSIKKGETLADTVKIVDSYSDIIVIRHSMEGAARLAAEFADSPVINAGDGAGRHPTQCLLDLFTIMKEKKRIEGLRVALVGDLRYGRTVHSLAYALALLGAELIFVSPESLKMPKEIVNDCRDLGAEPRSFTNLERAIKDVDVIYVTRIQKERFPDPTEYKKVVGSYRIDMDLLRHAKDDVIVMHPLPRVNEIDPEVDRTKHALYFRQAFYGVPVRMALLSLLLGVDVK